MAEYFTAERREDSCEGPDTSKRYLFVSSRHHQTDRKTEVSHPRLGREGSSLCTPPLLPRVKKLNLKTGVGVGDEIRHLQRWYTKVVMLPRSRACQMGFREEPGDAEVESSRFHTVSMSRSGADCFWAVGGSDSSTRVLASGPWAAGVSRRHLDLHNPRAAAGCPCPPQHPSIPSISSANTSCWRRRAPGAQCSRVDG
jgi:hypothetical protein